MKAVRCPVYQLHVSRDIGMKTPVLFSIALFLLAACTNRSQDAGYNFDKNTDLSNFKTYKWVSTTDASKVDDLRNKQIKAAVGAELANNGLTNTAADTADLYVGDQVGIDSEKQLTYFTGRTVYRPAWYAGWGGMTIYQGQLAIDMYDSTNHDLVWRGIASKTSVDPEAKLDKQQQNPAKAVRNSRRRTIFTGRSRCVRLRL